MDISIALQIATELAVFFTGWLMILFPLALIQRYIMN